MSDTNQQVLAALKKLGPSKPREIVDHIGADQAAVKKALKELLAAGDVKASGKTTGRIYALPGQEFQAADAPQQRKQKKGGKRKAGKKTRTTRPRPAAAADAFLPTVDADRNLVLINDAAVTRFNDAQTLAIATLLSQHYEA